MKGEGWMAKGVSLFLVLCSLFLCSFSKVPVGSQSLGRFCCTKFLLLLFGVNGFVGGIIEHALTWAGAVFCFSKG